MVASSRARISWIAPVLLLGWCLASTLNAAPSPAAGLDLPPECGFSVMLLDFGSVPLGHSRDLSAYVMNVGGGILQGTLAMQGDEQPCSQFAIIEGAGPFSLAAGESLRVTVRLTPATTDLHSCWLAANDGSGAARLCTGTTPLCGVPVTTVEFPSTPVGGFSRESVDVNNHGSGALELQARILEGPFKIYSGGTGTLGPGNSTSIWVEFRPVALGTSTGTLEISPECTPVSLIGPSSTQMNCGVTPTSIDFGMVYCGRTASRNFTVSTPDERMMFLHVTCSSDRFQVIPSGDVYVTISRGFTVIYHPDVPGTDSGTISLGNGVCAEVTCSGQATIAPPCAVSPPSIAFPQLGVGGSADASVSITNYTAGQLVGAISISGEQFSVTSGGGAFTLWPAQSLTVGVRYAPTACGEHAGLISTGVPECGDVPLSGRAVLCAVSPDTLWFEAPPNGVTGVEHEFLVANAGTTRMTGTVSSPDPAYTIRSGGTYDLQPGQSQSVIVVFVSEWGSHTDCVIDPGASCGGVRCYSFISNTPPEFAASVDTVRFGIVDIGDSSSSDFTLRNSGIVPVSGSLVAEGEGFTLTQGGGPFSLRPGGARAVQARFAPTQSREYAGTVQTGYGTFWLPLAGRGAVITAVQPPAVPRTTALHPIFPNPFNPQATVTFDLAKPSRARLEVFDVAGRRVRVLCDEDLPPGTHIRHWDGRTDRGRAAPSGAYYARLAADGHVALRRMTLVR